MLPVPVGIQVPPEANVSPANSPDELSVPESRMSFVKMSTILGAVMLVFAITSIAVADHNKCVMYGDVASDYSFWLKMYGWGVFFCIMSVMILWAIPYEKYLAHRLTGIAGVLLGMCAYQICCFIIELIVYITVVYDKCSPHDPIYGFGLSIIVVQPLFIVFNITAIIQTIKALDLLSLLQGR